MIYRQYFTPAFFGILKFKTCYFSICVSNGWTFSPRDKAWNLKNNNTTWPAFVVYKVKFKTILYWNSAPVKIPMFQSFKIFYYVMPEDSQGIIIGFSWYCRSYNFINASWNFLTNSIVLDFIWIMHNYKIWNSWKTHEVLIYCTRYLSPIFNFVKNYKENDNFYPRDVGL